MIFVLTPIWAETSSAINAWLVITGVLVGLVSAAILVLGIWLLTKKEPPQTSLWEDVDQMNKDEF